MRIPIAATALTLVWTASVHWTSASHAQDVSSIPLELRTRAERSQYQETSTCADVLEFCRTLTNRCAAARLLVFGKSAQGRELPLLVLAEPPVTAPDQLSGRPVVLCVGAIHGGEVCGKEALLMLAREWGLNRDNLPREFVVLLVPVYNADGADQISTENRKHQNGPAGGVGRRENAAGLDLNRDFMKLEAPETRALIKLVRDWDPLIIIDTHTTNGSKHRYALTYDGPRHPASDSALVDYARETFLPEVSRRMGAASNFDTFFYGNFEKDNTRWVTYPPQARYGTHYFGLRGRLAILSEAYAYATFEQRVRSTAAFVGDCLRVAREQKSELLALAKKVRERALHPSAEERVAVRAQLAPFPAKVSVKGYNVAGEPDAKELEDWTRSETTREVTLPFAYLIPRAYPSIVTNLLRHGIKVEELRETLELDTQRYYVQSVHRESEQYQGHHMASWTVESQPGKERVEAGTWLVRGAQPLGRLAALLLEPEAEDGLAAWNFCDDVKAGGWFPVSRLSQTTALLTAAMPPVPEERGPRRRVSFETLYGSNKVDLTGSPARIEAWMPDESKYLQVADGKLQRVDPGTGRRENFFDAARVQAALEQLPEFDAKAAAAISARTRFQMDPSRQGALLEHENDLYFFRFDGTRAVRLTWTPAAEELAEFSPDGAWISFVRENNLYVVSLSNQVERALTTDGGPDLLNGKAGWVYYEEVYHRKWKAYWWSPDSRQIAFLRFDERALPIFHALDTVPLHGRLESMRHPKAGDPNPSVRLGVVTAAGGAPRWVDLDTYTDFLVMRVGWVPAGGAVYFYVQDRAQRWLDFLLWNPPGPKAERLFRETTSAWVDDPGDALFLKGGDIVLPSERSGWRHLYRYHRADRMWTALTEGEWEVREVLGLDPQSEHIYFTGSRDSAVAENLYRCSVEGGTSSRVTSADGHHTVSLSPKCQFVVDQWSTFTTPAQVQLLHGDGELVRLLDANPVHALEDFDLAPSDLIQVPAKDGFIFEGCLTQPLNFSSDRTYPVWFMTYGGPRAATVRDAWGSARLFDQMLAAMGVVVFRMDPRSASGKGSRAVWSIYRQLGVQELSDISEGIEWLKKKPFVDGARIGMSGHSYGGFMTAYALTHSKLFAAGIAGAPVTDWHYYDSIYTERYMDTPDNNPSGYAATSVVTAATDLRGHLLLLHGMVDDNVHLQNATALVQALQKANRDFEVMFYPDMKHGLSGAHYQRLMVDFIRRSLGLEEQNQIQNPKS